MATTVCATVGVHTLRVARKLWLVLHCAHFALYMRVHTHTPMAQGCEKGMCSAHVVTLHLTFSLLMFHPSAQLPSDNLLAPRVSLSYSRNSCWVYPDPKSRVRRTSATVKMTLATWPTCPTPQEQSNKQPKEVLSGSRT